MTPASSPAPADGPRAPAVRLGANYTPRRGWFYSWLDLDPAEISEDLAQIAELGLDHVRIFPLWPLLQPHRSLIRTTAIDDVVRVADLAGEHGLDVSVDVLQGHLSSFDFLPAWVSTWHRRSLFTDPDVVAAQQQLASALAAALADRPHVTGLTLGNEIGQFARPDHPDVDAIAAADATGWNAALLGTLEAAMPHGRHHHSFDDALWFTDAHPFTPASAVQQGDATTVHSWVFTGAGQALGVDAPGLGLFGRYLIEVADCWHHLLGVPADRRIWLQEIGAPTPWVPAQSAPAFADTSIRAAIGNPKVDAVTWWCSHDVSRDLVDYPEVEYTLGLFDSDGRIKPIGEAVGALAAEQRRTGRLSPIGGREETPEALEPIIVPRLSPDGSDRSILAPAGTIFAQWIDEAIAGRIRPIRARSTED